MWSFITSVVMFLVLVGLLRLWQRHNRQQFPSIADPQIYGVAEVAQRLHVQRFGRASTDVTATINEHVASKS